MTTIEIIAEVHQEKTIYRAICGQQEATGASPGEALDSIEQQLTTLGDIGNIGDINDSQTLIILQRFRPDSLFTREQQNKLQELMSQHHQAVATQKPLSTQQQEELENLVETEFEAAIERSSQLLSQIESNSSELL